jgi:hypothetical protein
MYTTYTHAEYIWAQALRRKRHAAWQFIVTLTKALEMTRGDQ